MRAYLLVATLACASACSVEADYTGTLFQCNPDGTCPTNYTCIDDRCVPVEPAGTTCADTVAAGAQHTCARRTDGTIWCWGRNDFGQVGDASTTDRASPVQVSGVLAAIDVHAGDLHSCAVLDVGTVRCWGRNANGQLGDGS